MITYAYGVAQQSKSVAVLNMANAVSPGGGFLGGARAQEEQLCHRSSLFPRLKLHKYYNEQNYIAESTCLVTPQVHILRDGFDTEHATADSQLFGECATASVTVLSAAARRYGSIGDAQRDSGLPGRMVQTWKAVLSAASASGASQLVVSALGCGAFNNPPQLVGRALAVALSECSPGSCLEEVHVVIMEDHNSHGRNEKQFREGFDDSESGGAAGNSGAVTGGSGGSEDGAERPSKRARG